METVILSCTCVHEFQDAHYKSSGIQNPRVHNVTFKGDDATCTVCGKKKPIKGNTTKKKK